MAEGISPKKGLTALTGGDVKVESVTGRTAYKAQHAFGLFLNNHRECYFFINTYCFKRFLIYLETKIFLSYL